MLRKTTLGLTLALSTLTTGFGAAAHAESFSTAPKREKPPSGKSELVIAQGKAADASSWSHRKTGDADTRVEFNIDARKLARALIQLTEQAGLQLIYPAGYQFTDFSAAPLKGVYTAREALEILLRHTRLEYEFLDPHTISILDPNAKPIAAALYIEDGSGSAAPGPSRIRLALAEDQERTATPANSAAPSERAVADEPSNAVQPMDDIVVTGSRIARDGYNAQTPVTTVSSEELLLGAPTNLPDALNQLPQFGNSLSQRNGNVVDPLQQGGGNSLDLRSLGPNRVLILLDGQRVSPNNTRGIVDINTFPQLLVKSVDVVTAGVSAVYGADAVSGVVNFVLDRKFEGVKGFAQGGTSSRGDNESFAAGVAFGQSIMDDRLHVLFSAEYNRADGVARMSDRALFRKNYLRVGSGTEADPYRTVANVNHSFVTFGGVVANGPLAGMAFQPDGSLAPFDFGVPQSRGYQIGGDGANWGDPGLIPSLENQNVFGRAELQVTDNVTAYVQLSYARSESKVDQYLNFNFGDITIFQDNAFLNQTARDALIATNTPSFNVLRINRDFGYVGNELDNRSPRFALGLEGTLSDDWKWKTYGTYGESTLRGELPRQAKPVELAAALDAVVGPNGQIVCNITVTNPGLRDDCVPIDIFGDGSPSDAALAYVTGTNKYKVVNDALEFGAEIAGDLFDLPAGPLSTAFGASYRRQTIEQTSTSDPSITVDATGVRGVGSTKAFTVTNFGTADGSANAKEVFVEASAPILHELPLIERLELNGAARYVDYSTFGGKSVWKAGMVYQITPDFRFRLTRSRDIRAPSLYNQFSGQQTVVETLLDPLTGVQGTTLQTGGGNPDLDPEKADTLTFGLGFQPSSIPGLRFSVDYYDVKIEDAINTVTGQSILTACHGSGYTDPLCSLVTRPLPISDTSAANFPTAINSLTDINIGSLRTKGIDFEASYSTAPRFVPGTINLRLFANYVDTFEIDNGPGAQEYAGFVGSGLIQKNRGGLPQWRATLSATYTNGAFSLFLQERFIDAMSQIGGNTPDDVYSDDSAHISSVAYTDLSLEYEFASLETKAFVSVNNLFDKKPPLVADFQLPSIQFPSIGTVYDLVGQYITLGVRTRF
ncbi:MAG TPA: TonB-dependent receptor [Steroidobacteraceae bacterium]|nr:TonB-dependent receptor [Steroidobacteraceae bacterium]